MAVATCWNCRNPVSGAVCPTCGAQQAMSAPGYPPSAPAQPSVSQASVSYRQDAPMYGQGQPSAPNYPMGGQGQPYGGQGYGAGWQQPGANWQQPMGMQAGMRAPAASAGMGQQVLLAALYGAVAAVVGALIWAFFLNITKLNISYLAIGLGFLVGIGVVLGSRGQRHMVYMVLAGVLGLLSFVLALYFRISLIVAPILGDSSANVFALPFGDFSEFVKLYLKENPINYIYFVAVLLVAVLTTVGRTAQRMARR